MHTLETPHHHINEVVKIFEDLTNETAVAVITEINITKDGIRYKAKIGFSEDIIYDKDEFRFFEDDCEPTYRIIGRIGYIDKVED